MTSHYIQPRSMMLPNSSDNAVATAQYTPGAAVEVKQRTSFSKQSNLDPPPFVLLPFVHVPNFGGRLETQPHLHPRVSFLLEPTMDYISQLKEIRDKAFGRQSPLDSRICIADPLYKFERDGDGDLLWHCTCEYKGFTSSGKRLKAKKPAQQSAAEEMLRLLGPDDRLIKQALPLSKDLMQWASAFKLAGDSILVFAVTEFLVSTLGTSTPWKTTILCSFIVKGRPLSKDNLINIGVEYCKGGSLESICSRIYDQLGSRLLALKPPHGACSRSCTALSPMSRDEVLKLAMNIQLDECLVPLFLSDSQLLQQALTHSSVGLGNNNYELLEHVGDRIIKMILVRSLARRLMDERRPSPDNLSNSVDTIISERTMVAVADKLKLREHIRVKTEGNMLTDRIKANVVESLAAALWSVAKSTGGNQNQEAIVAVEKTVIRWFDPFISETLKCCSAEPLVDTADRKRPREDSQQ